MWYDSSTVLNIILSHSEDPVSFEKNVLEYYMEWKESNDDVLPVRFDRIDGDIFDRHSHFLPKEDLYHLRKDSSGVYKFRYRNNRKIPKGTLGMMESIMCIHNSHHISEIDEEGYLEVDHLYEEVDVFVFAINFDWFAYRDSEYLKTQQQEFPNEVFTDIRDFISELSDEEVGSMPDWESDANALAAFRQFGPVQTSDFLVIITNRFRKNKLTGENLENEDWSMKYNGVLFGGWLSPAYFTYRGKSEVEKMLPLIRNPDVKFTPMNYARTFLGLGVSMKYFEIK